MISIKNLKKSFNNKPVLKGISCEFEKGKIEGEKELKDFKEKSSGDTNSNETKSD